MALRHGTIPSDHSVWCLINYGFFHSSWWGQELFLALCEFWALFFIILCVVVSQVLGSFLTWADHYLAEDSRVALCRSPELSLLWNFPANSSCFSLPKSQHHFFNSVKLPVPAGKAWLFSMCLLHPPIRLTWACSHGYGIEAWLETEQAHWSKQITWVSPESRDGKMKIRTMTVINLHNQFYGPWYMSYYSLERISNVTNNIYVYIFLHCLFSLEFYIFLFELSVLGYMLVFFSSGNWFWTIYNIL